VGSGEKEMKYLVVLVAFFLTGCATVSVPVKAKFPIMPDTLLVKCPQLEQTKEDAKLSDISKVIAGNYTTYYECAVKHEAIVEWYKIQKTIYESVK
jgi:starvation-inducible outer membrane lipoprotein